MTLLPFFDVTFVSALKKEQVIGKIVSNLKLKDGSIPQNSALFNGVVSADSFRISLIIKSAQNALPLITGRVENTSLGSIIFLKLSLFPAAKLFLLSSSLLCLIIGFVFLMIPHSILGLNLSVFLGLMNYLVLTLNFQKRAKDAVDILKGILG
ncbi:MAG: hypothetical protein ACI83W_001444 [Marinoscillum sp.]|jgi:hypothetical protein